MENIGQKKLRIAFMGSEDYRNFVQDEARKRRIKVQQFLEDAVAAYCSTEKRGSPTQPRQQSAKNRRWHDDLDVILNDPAERVGIEKNLYWAVEAIKSKPGKAK